ncbi:MAG: hypothetical protein HYV07_27505 [Deltaproteobacteria bacterium]|nr:hypothetical protein [Deltaproteobacteria bacterium]
MAENQAPPVAQYYASQTASALDLPGIYAWYYAPDVRSPEAFTSRVLPVLESFVHDDRTAYLEVSDSYRMRLVGEASLHRAPTERGRTLREILDLLVKEPAVRNQFFSRTFITAFCRPIYIGLTERSLRTRVYEEHFLGLDSLWDENSAVSRYLSAGREAVSVDEVAARLGLNHSFALEARVRGIRTRDLLAQLLYLPRELIDWLVEEDGGRNPLRDLERVLQLLSFPVCGRV